MPAPSCEVAERPLFRLAVTQQKALQAPAQSRDAFQSGATSRVVSATKGVRDARSGNVANLLNASVISKRSISTYVARWIARVRGRIAFQLRAAGHNCCGSRSVLMLTTALMKAGSDGSGQRVLNRMAKPPPRRFFVQS